ncbi:hypothetical protein MN116_005604 [Schistosoma mekongi]|uniref:Spc7 kinetochore protein domain-containing protein n=1 Tax=Schistosoma mekongi TaxID=38744 RepID=A0AAE2D3X6_SCHME|nr:hypothetical protein MN116_005604 [Schistosoma mekongi]
MITSSGNGKPRRSSLKFAFDPVESTSDPVVSARSLNRRVSFSQYVFVLGDEDDGSQMCVSHFNSNISMEDELAIDPTSATTNNNSNSNATNISVNMDDVASIIDVSMEVTPDPCLEVKHIMSANEQQNTNMEIKEDNESASVNQDLVDVNILSSKCNSSLESNAISNHDKMIVQSEFSNTPEHDSSDMEVQISSICPLPTSELENMFITSNNEFNPSTVTTTNNSNNSRNTDQNSPNHSLHNGQDFQSSCNNVPGIVIPTGITNDVELGKSRTPEFKSYNLPLTNTMVMAGTVNPSLSSFKRPSSVVKMPLINLNLSNSVPLTKRPCHVDNNDPHSAVNNKTPKTSESEKITFLSLINTPLRQANIGVDNNVGVSLNSVKKVNRFRNFRDVNEYKPERLLSNTRRLHSHLHNQLMKCQLEPVIDLTDYDLSNITSIMNFLLKNKYVNCNLENVNRTTLLTNIEQYGSNEYLELQNKLGLHLYDKFIKRRFVVETENIHRLEYWKCLYQERINTVLVSPQLKSVMKKISEMDSTERLEFMAGVHQLLHNCSKFALQEIYQIIDEHTSARNLELNLEIDDLKHLNSYVETVIDRKQHDIENQEQKWKQLDELDKYAKETLQKLDTIKQEINEATQRRNTIRQSNEELLKRKKHLESKLRKLSSRGKNINELHRLNRSVGCTELFPIPIDEKSIDQNFSKSDVGDKSSSEAILMEKITNLFSPCRITCTSFDTDSHIYEVSTLFGLVNFILTCQVCCNAAYDAGRQMTNNNDNNVNGDCAVVSDDDDNDDDDDMQITIDPENLKVISLQVTSPTDLESPVECPPVESVARICIEYLSTIGYDSLRTRCIGFTMDNVIEQIEIIIVPYMVLASDLRCLWLAKFDVNIVMMSINDQLPSSSTGYCCFTPKNLRTLTGQTPRSTAVRSLPYSSRIRTPFQQRQQSYHQSVICGDSSIPTAKSLTIFEYLTPPGPFSITVKLSTRTYCIVIRFTLFSLDYMNNDQGHVDFEILRGNPSIQKLNEYLKDCKPTSGNMYSIASNLQSYLSFSLSSSSPSSSSVAIDM